MENFRIVCVHKKYTPDLHGTQTLRPTNIRCFSRLFASMFYFLSFSMNIEHAFTSDVSFIAV